MKLSKTPRRYIWRFLFVAGAIAVVAGWPWSRGKDMDEKIMMRASFDEPLFDASPWFHSGTYQRLRNDDQALRPGLEYSQIIMMRTSPQPFSDEEVQYLRVRIYMALTHKFSANFQPAVPAAVESIGVGADFDPRPQTVYVSSGFQRGVEAPGRPVDIYHFYTLLDGKRFFVFIERDGASGKIIYTSRDINFRLPKDEEERRFQELQAKADRQAWLEKACGGTVPLAWHLGMPRTAGGSTDLGQTAKDKAVRGSSSPIFGPIGQPSSSPQDCGQRTHFVPSR